MLPFEFSNQIGRDERLWLPSVVTDFIVAPLDEIEDAVLSGVTVEYLLCKKLPIAWLGLGLGNFGVGCLCVFVVAGIVPFTRLRRLLQFRISPPLFTRISQRLLEFLLPELRLGC